jgi:hypothetical protein
MDTAHLAEAVTVEAVMSQAQVIVINPLSGPVKVALAAFLPVLFGSAAAYQYGAISGPLASLLMIGSFSALVIIFGNDPRVIQNEARTVEIQPAVVIEPIQEDESEGTPQADEVSKPFKNSLQIRFYEPPRRESGVSVSWEAVCYVCREALNGRAFSERAMAVKGAPISGADFRLLSSDFRRRGYTVLQPGGKTAFTDRGETQVKKLSALPY